MGRTSYKLTTDGLLWLDTTRLNEWGYFKTNKAGTLYWTNRTSGDQSSVDIKSQAYTNQPRIHLFYTTNSRNAGVKQVFDYDILLEATPCYFGGQRWWLLCPLVYKDKACHRRTRRLYKRGSYFGCRQCQKLTYPSQNENRHEPWGKFVKLITYDSWADRLEQKIRVKYYKGKPTRRMRRYLTLQQYVNDHDYLWRNLDAMR